MRAFFMPPHATGRLAVQRKPSHDNHAGIGGCLLAEFEKLAEQENFELFENMIDEQAYFRFSVSTGGKVDAVVDSLTAPLIELREAILRAMSLRRDE